MLSEETGQQQLLREVVWERRLKDGILELEPLQATGNEDLITGGSYW